jgi:hypothetical protein
LQTETNDMGLVEKPTDPHGLTLEAWAQVSKKTKSG